MFRSKATPWLCLTVMLTAAAWAAGCGAPAQAEPLDVTYYYLPG